MGNRKERKERKGKQGKRNISPSSTEVTEGPERGKRLFVGVLCALRGEVVEVLPFTLFAFFAVNHLFIPPHASQTEGYSLG